MNEGPMTIAACPDGGTCHHECEGGGPCFRVSVALPLSGVYPDDRWPEAVLIAHGMRGAVEREPLNEPRVSAPPTLAESIAQIAEDVHRLAGPHVDEFERGRIFMSRKWQVDETMRFEPEGGEVSSVQLSLVQWEQLGRPDHVVITVEAR